MTIEDKFISATYEKICNCILNFNANDTPHIYAISFWYDNIDDDQRRPTLQIGYNTMQQYEKKISEASDAGEAKWNFAFWLQNEDLEIGGEEALFTKWVKQLPEYFTDEEEDEDFDRTLELGSKIHDRFMQIVIEIAQKLHANGIIIKKFGKQIPIIVHELEMYLVPLRYTVKANPSSQAAEFEHWYWNHYPLPREYETWATNFRWIEEFTKRKNWEEKRGNISGLVIKPPVNLSAILKIEDELNVKYPVDFVEAMVRYSSGVLLNWHMGDEENKEFKGVFCGGGYGYIWDIDELRNVHKDYIGWITDCYNDPEDDYGKVYYNKTPFMSVPNGDIIAFDNTLHNGNHAVIYLSHDDGSFHGHKLAKNFKEFITKWSNIGCVGTEEWQFHDFYDHAKKELSSDSEKVKKWRNFLNQ